MSTQPIHPQRRTDDHWLHDRLLLTVIAAAAVVHLPTALLRVPFWDDWTILNAPDPTLNFRLNGNVEFGLLHSALIATEAPVVLASLLTYLGSIGLGVAIYRICRHLMSDRQAFGAALLSAVAPLVFARITLITTPSFLALLLFAIASDWFLIVVQKERAGRLERLLVGLLFAITFVVQSFLAFIYLVLLLGLHLHVRYRTQRVGNASLSTHIKHYVQSFGLFFVLPPVYFILRSHFLPPTGPYANRNAFSVDNLERAPELLHLVTTRTTAVFAESVLAQPALPFIIGAAAVPWLVLVGRRSRDSSHSGPDGNPAVVVLVALVACLAAILPYVIVGKPPLPVDWATRHQLLLLFSVGPLLVGILSLLPRQSYWPALAVTCALLAASTLSGYGEYSLDVARQQAVLEALGATDSLDREALEEATTVTLSTDSPYATALNRNLRVYETTHMYREALDISRRDLVVFASPIAPTEEGLRALAEGSESGRLGIVGYRPGDQYVDVQLHVEEAAVPSGFRFLALLLAPRDWHVEVEVRSVEARSVEST